MSKDRALAGLKVIDLTTALSGPFCTMFFGDYGAEVIKVEPAGAGDQTRSWGPFEEKSGESAYFCAFNRNKKGVTLNLKSEKGLQMFYDLVKDADILCENFKGGVTKKLKIDYETLKKMNPGLIYASISGFGEGSPISHRPCYDVVAQAMGGILNLGGFPETDPVKTGPSIADHVSGIYQCVGVLIALYYREKTGKGQHVDIAMFDSIFSILENAIVNYTLTGEIPQREGNIDPAIAPFDVYKCKDGFVALGVGNNNLWTKFCNAVHMEHLLTDERFTTNDLRVKNYKSSLQGIIRDWAANYTKKEIEDIMDKAQVPCGPVMDMKEAVEHPHTKAREMVVKSTHPTAGDLYFQGVVAKLSESPGGVYTPAPLLGQHNREVFGLSENEEKALREEGVI